MEQSNIVSSGISTLNKTHARISLYVYNTHTRADNGSMDHGSMGQMGHIFWMGQWVLGQIL